MAYVHRQLGLPIASTAPLARVTEAFDKAVHRFAHDHAIPWVNFAKGQRKDDIAHEHLAGFTGTEGALFVGRAQEKTKLFHTEKRRDACVHDRLLPTGLAHLADHTSAPPLQAASRAYNKALENITHTTLFAA